MGSVTQANTEWDWEDRLDPDDAAALPMDALALFWRDVDTHASETRLLDRDEERALMRRARLGDQTARHALVTHNLRLVGHMATAYRPYLDISREDVIQSGMLGLIHATKLCDERGGTTFSTYACQWIQQAMQRAFIRQRTGHLRLPDYVYVRVRREVRESGVPSPLERQIWSLDAQVSSTQTGVTGEETWGAFIRGPDVVLPSSTSALLARLAGVLDARTLRIIVLRLGLDDAAPMKFAAIARELGDLSRERVRQLYERGMRTLRAAVPNLWPEHAGRTVVRTSTPKPAPRPMKLMQKAG